MVMRRLMLSAFAAAAASTMVLGQPAASLPVETLLKDRLGVSAVEIARFTGGETVVWNVPGSVGNEIAGAGAIRTKGDLRRLVAWLKDIEAFMRAAGTVNVGAIGEPPTAADFARISFDDVNVSELSSCRPGQCDFRMPAKYIDRFQTVDWKAGDAKARAAALTRDLLGEYVTAYQKGGDAALGAHHNQKSPNQIADQFQDMLRRATKVWDLAFPFASYLETFPKAAPAGTESRFYWTRDKVGFSPALTLHHVVLQQFPDGRVLLADKQFYASRQIDVALMIALAIPNADHTSFDLIVSVKARADAVGGVAGRVLRGRIEKEMTEGLKVYLEWIRGSMAL
jgi:hypothetical protein